MPSQPPTVTSILPDDGLGNYFSNPAKPLWFPTEHPHHTVLHTVKSYTFDEGVQLDSGLV